MSLKAIWQQFFPSEPPAFTEAPVGQKGKVFIRTGATSGIGRELAGFLYPTGATVYLAGRSQERIGETIREIETTAPAARAHGVLKSLVGLDSGDLSTIKAAYERFASQENELHIIWNNAALAPKFPSIGSSTPQGLETHMGTNAVGAFLFTKLLVPLLRTGSKNASDGQPSRVVWTGSVQIEMNAPPGGIDFTKLNTAKTTNLVADYSFQMRKSLSCPRSRSKMGRAWHHQRVSEPWQLVHRQQSHRGALVDY